MKLALCTKFQVNLMNCVETRKGGGPIDPPPPSRLRVTIFSRRLLGLMCLNVCLIYRKLGRNRIKVLREGISEHMDQLELL